MNSKILFVGHIFIAAVFIMKVCGKRGEVPTKTDLNVIATSLTSNECKLLVSLLRTEFRTPSSKTISLNDGVDSTSFSFDCLANMEMTLTGLSLLKTYPSIVKQLQYLNRSDVAHFINKQYLHANADVVKTYLASQNIKENPLAEKQSFVSGQVDSDGLISSLEKSEDNVKRIFSTPEFSFIYLVLGLYGLLLFSYILTTKVKIFYAKFLND